MDTPDKRTKLLRAALHLFATRGYHVSKVSDIVKEAGVAQGTFYWYFSSKEEIALEIIKDGQRELLDVIRQGYRERSGTVEDMVDSSLKLIKSLLQFSCNNRDFMILLLLKGQGADEPIRKEISETFIAIEEAFAKNINRAIELKMLEDRRDVSFQAQILTNHVTGMLSRWLFGPYHDINYEPEKPLEDVAKEIVHFEFFGLLGRKEVVDENSGTFGQGRDVDPKQ